MRRLGVGLSFKDNELQASVNEEDSVTNPRGDSLILIGMPGAGKSTIGVLLAKELAKGFVDTDLLIQETEGKSLQDIVRDSGYQALRKVEEAVLLNVHYPNHVIATGGSAVYSEPAMKHLKTLGRVVFLDVPQEELERRIKDYAGRGIACPPDQSFTTIYTERFALYQQYADIVVDCGVKKQQDIVSEIIFEEGEGYAEMDA